MSAEPVQWHAGHEALLALVDGSAGPLVAASLEAHLMRCDDCRAELNRLAFTDEVENTWLAVRDLVQAPVPGLVERILNRLGVRQDTGRLLAAVPAMRGGWLVGITTALVFAGLAAMFSRDLGLGMFLFVAPLVPVAGVAASFGGDADPAHELVVTTPYSAGRLLLLRTIAVLATSAPIAMLVGLTLPGPGWLTVAWLSPAAAGIGLTLVLAPMVGLTTSATGVGVVWSVVSLTISRVQDPLVLVGPVSQLICLSLVAVSLVAVLTRSQILDLPRRAI